MGLFNRKLKVMIVYDQKNAPMQTPRYATVGSAGFDIAASKLTYIEPGATALIDCGFSVKVPKGYELQIRSRSSLAGRRGLVVMNSPGTVDSDYTGPIKVILHNFGKTKAIINYGDRIAQGVFTKVWQASWVEVKVLPVTKRGSGGFGSTGV